jgi:carboxylate-amine ligase
VAVRQVGVEEELLLVDPATRTASPEAPRVLRRVGGRADEIEPELFRHQIEIQTEPTSSADALGPMLRELRREASSLAAAEGLALAASGTLPTPLEPDLLVTENPRYRAMLDTFGEVAHSGGTCGLHVHVDVGSDEEAVAVLDRIGSWLPVVLALSTNSPFAHGRDTRHASWRAQQWSHWPSSGPTAPFGSLAAYRSLTEALIGTGAARDVGMLYFDARLAERYDTVEVRVADATTDPDDAVLVAALVRGLVATAAASWADGAPVTPRRTELLRAARWRASRYGLAEGLVHPSSWAVEAASDVLDSLVSHVRPALEAAGDLDLVTDGVRRVLAGTGATRQRAAFERTGSLDGVVDDLIARTAASF